VSNSNGPAVATPSAISQNQPVTTPTVSTSPEKGKEEKTFTFTVQNGMKISAGVYANPAKPEDKVIIFTPFLEKTDGNLYNSALNTFWTVYGKKRGHFQLTDAQTTFDASLGGNAICWQVKNPAQQYCVFPIKDSETQKIASLRIWLK